MLSSDRQSDCARGATMRSSKSLSALPKGSGAKGPAGKQDKSKSELEQRVSMFSPVLAQSIKRRKDYPQSAKVALAEKQRLLLMEQQRAKRQRAAHNTQPRSNGNSRGGMLPSLQLNSLRQPMKEHNRNQQAHGGPAASLVDPPSAAARDPALPQFARVPDDPTVLEALFRTEGLVKAIDKAKTYADLLKALRTICSYIVDVAKVQLVNLYAVSPLWKLLLCIVSESAGCGDGKSRGSSFSSSSSSSSSLPKARKTFEGLKLSAVKGICGHVCQNGKSVLLDSHVGSDWRYDRISDDRSGYSNRSLLAVPVRNVTGDIVAILETRNSLRVGGFSEQDELFISSNCEYIALIFSKLFFLVEKHELFKRNYAQHLLSMTDTTTPTSGAREVMENLVNCISVSVQCELVNIWIPCAELQEVVLTCAKGLNQASANPFEAKQVGARVPYGGVLVGRAALLGRSFVVNKVQCESRLRTVPNSTDEASVQQTRAAEVYWGALDLTDLEEVRNMMIVPFQNRKGEIVVILECINRLDSEIGMAANFDTKLKSGDYLRPAPFSEDDRLHCEKFQEAAVAAIERVGRSITTKAEAKRYNALLKIVEHVNGEDEFGTTMKKVVGLAYDLLPADQISLSLIRTFAKPIELDASPEVHSVQDGAHSTPSATPTPGPAHGLLRRAAMKSKQGESPGDMQLSAIVDIKQGRRGSMNMNQDEVKRLQHNLAVAARSANRSGQHSGRGGNGTPRKRHGHRRQASHGFGPGMSTLTQRALSKELRESLVGYSIVQELVPFVAKESRVLSFVFPVAERHGVERPDQVGKKAESTIVFLDGGLMAYAAFTKDPIVVADAQQHPRFNPSVDEELGYQTKSMMAFPIICNGGTVGVVTAVNRSVYFPYLDLRQVRCPVGGTLAEFTKFSVQDLAYMQSVAAAMASIFAKLDSKRRLAVNERILNAILGLLKLSDENLLNESGEDALMRKIHTIIAVTYEALSADRVTLYFVEGKEVFTVASKDIKGIRFPVGKGITGCVAVTGEAEMLEDCYNDPRFKGDFDRKTKYRTKSMLVMPIKDSSGNVIAVLQALNKLDMTSFTNTIGGVVRGSNATNKDFNLDAVISFDEDDRQILQAICQQVSDTLRKSIYHATQKNLQAHLKSEEQVDVLSLVDSFTGKVTRARSSTLDSVEEREVDADLQRLGSVPEPSPVPVTPIANDSLPFDAKQEAQVLGEGKAKQNANEEEEEEEAFVAEWPKHVRLLDLPDSDDPDFNPYDYDLDTLAVVTFSLFRRMNVFKTMPVSQTTVKNFVLQVRKQYRDNWFHNFYHSCSVMHFASIMIARGDFVSVCGQETCLAMLMAALCHDLDHPGNTNQFEINTESDLATLHNDISVLENHHCHQTILLLRKEGCNVLESFSRETQRSMKADIISGIMSTDMTQHMDALQALNLCGDLKQVSDNMKLLLNMVIHTADLSGQAFPRKIALEWERRISREFAEQAHKEEQLGFNVLPFMKDLHIPQRRGLLQTQFLDFVLIPWWNRVVTLVPQLSMYFDNIMSNRRFYDNVARGIVEAVAMDEMAYEIRYGEYESEPESEPGDSALLEDSMVLDDGLQGDSEPEEDEVAISKPRHPHAPSKFSFVASQQPVVEDEEDGEEEREEEEISELRRRRRERSQQLQRQKSKE